MPTKGVVDQKRIMEGLLAKGIDGIAVSPVDAENQTTFLNEVAENSNLITQDADAPASKRIQSTFSQGGRRCTPGTRTCLEEALV